MQSADGPLRRGVVSAREVISVIMGGGAGTRLFPLTLERSKPAVPLGGTYRLVDIPISNCLNSGLRRIFLLTQFNSSSLHRHVQHSYQFDYFSKGFVEIMAAQQTPSSLDWYQGTADAVRQNMEHFRTHHHELVLILSGDQLYRMDFRRLLDQHRQTGAEVTVATLPVDADAASGFGILQLNAERRITRFVEKPANEEARRGLELDTGLVPDSAPTVPTYLASMGIYVFERHVLDEALATDLTDFGRDIIPRLIQTHRVYGYVYQGYWEDIGTIGAFFAANLNLTEPEPLFNFFDEESPIYTHARYLPGSKVTDCRVDRAVIADGCILDSAHIERAIVGIRSRVEAGVSLRETIVMGQDYYETPGAVERATAAGIPRMGIGAGSRLFRTIVDKNARIGQNVHISPQGKPAHLDGDGYYIRDGIVVIPKNAIVPHNTVV